MHMVLYVNNSNGAREHLVVDDLLVDLLDTNRDEMAGKLIGFRRTKQK